MIIFLYGEDTFRSRQKLKDLKDKFLREIDPQGTSLAVLEGEKVNLDKLNQAIGSVSLLSKKRMVVIENLFARKDDEIFSQFYTYLTSKNEKTDDNIIIVWDEIGSASKGLTKGRGVLFKFLAQSKYAQEFKPLSNLELLNWLKKEVEMRKAQISHEAANTLVSLVGNDLWALNNDLDKLVNYKAGQQLHLSGEARVNKIETSDVRELVSGSIDENIFALTDAISNRNKNLVVKLFQEQIEAGSTGDYLLNMILRQFKILLQVRQALDSGSNARNIASTLKLHPFVVQKAVTQVRNFNLTNLKSIFDRLVKMDYEMKTGKTDVLLALNMLIVKL